ncbi:MAG: ABC transporter ATP-binding protein [Deltaproteobacteria bacterium HGW-Deltaproteobacteria-7]|jgi:zinc transport system ATP-binding protein|nr:MAG: ABC transporter ATP-binding protein [Deltaproteobacteria bacterium HGW-Deltaproteobacteria-7]PKN20060.1 MAG: ABC transporter ATP-binding protein [Deltaproteobacteria bacterium HGW-Deltaproteobacteria-6]
MPVIRADNLTFRYNGLDVISDVTFFVEKGIYLGIVGPNGSGKSTLIKCILGILKPELGRVELFGKPPDIFRQWEKIGYLPQRLSALNAHFPGTVEEIVQMGLPKKDAATLRRTLEMMAIGHLASRLIGELSYGEQQRAMLARALMRRPELLIFDEPTTALDPETREIFYSLTKMLNQGEGTTIILITHDSGIIGQYAQNLLYLDKKVIFSGTFKDFCSSGDMTGLFGPRSQHIICHQHDQTREGG